MKSRITILLSLFVWAVSCKQPVHKRNNEIARISFASGGCYGRCPLLAIEIDSNLVYKFYGGKYCEKAGYYTGKISQDFWDSLNIKFESINYKMLDTFFVNSVDDLATETILFYNGQTKKIRAQSSSLPWPVDSIFNWLMFSYRRINLINYDDSIKFQTSMQYPPEPVETKIKKGKKFSSPK